MRLIAKGSEADVYLVTYHGCKAILKVRRRKQYRHPLLDNRRIVERTKNEVLNMIKAYENGLYVPLVLDFDIRQGKILMTFIDGIPLAEKLDIESIRKAGEALARLHSLDIAHWDYTTLNVLRSNKNGRIYIIDFGLSKHTQNYREKAVDVHLMLRSLKSIHRDLEGKLIESFWRGYSEYGDVDLMKQGVSEIESMGRYVRTRRKTIW